MEPKFSAPNASPERLVSSGYESAPQQRPEIQVSPDRRAETRPEQRTEQAPVAPRAGVLPPPVVAVPVSGAQPTSPVKDDTSATPLTAGDDDLIEKEWVDKAKKIVASTKGDPYRREQEVGRLQEDYLRKRYGKELGEAV